ncbi:hypothetical protein V8C43DRAFT_293437 [Trichoderma afarasin]
MMCTWMKAHLAFTRKTCRCFSGSACVNRPPCLCCYVCCLSACLPPKDLLPLDQAIITARHDITYALATTRTSRKKVIHHIFPEDDGGPPKPHADDKDRNKRKSYSKSNPSETLAGNLMPVITPVHFLRLCTSIRREFPSLGGFFYFLMDYLSFHHSYLLLAKNKLDASHYLNAVRTVATTDTKREEGVLIRALLHPRWNKPLV